MPLLFGTGYVAEGMCTCLRTIYRDAQVQELTYTIGMPPTYFQDINLLLFSDERCRNIPNFSAGKHALHIHVCRTFLDKQGVRGNLFFSGPPGTGKTFVAAVWHIRL